MAGFDEELEARFGDMPDFFGSIAASWLLGRPRRIFRKEQTEGAPITVAPVDHRTSRKCSSWPWVTQTYLACLKSSR